MVALSSKHFSFQHCHFFSVEPQQLTSVASTETTNDVITFLFHWVVNEWPFLPLSSLLDKMPQNTVIVVQGSSVTLKSSQIVLDQNQMK